ncbi:MAG: GTP 3',8-cyclase MoaA [Clostridia bacterium]|nr:GTP 3',8-cyclase MoaA [Clostridia bacterium]
MIDKCGRKIDYLRISVTDRCNFRCVYCMPEQGVPPIAHTQIISFEEILRICRVMAGLGIRKLKVTGGEPLVRRGVCDFIRAAKELPGIEQVTLTTNGALLPQYLPELIASRIDGVNISLDTLDPDTYRRITRRGCLADVLAAINAAWEAGIPRLKINSVLLSSINDQEAVSLAALARDRDINVRFIELMPIGLGQNFKPIPGAEILAQLTAAYGEPQPFCGRIGNGPAAYYSFPGLKGKIGFIDAISHRFCSECNRVRLTAEGHLKLCLHYDHGLDLLPLLRAGCDDEQLQHSIVAAIEAKPLSHSFGRPEASHTDKHTMNSIGG